LKKQRKSEQISLMFFDTNGPVFDDRWMVVSLIICPGEDGWQFESPLP
jgi:hypothetical protein